MNINFRVVNYDLVSCLSILIILHTLSTFGETLA